MKKDEAKPIVIRSRTLMPAKDFKEWTKRIRETNPDAVVIPCDAEIVSTEAVQGKWIKHFDDLFPEDSTIECSICHKHQPMGIDENYCPNCGKKMKGSDSE